MIEIVCVKAKQKKKFNGIKKMLEIAGKKDVITQMLNEFAINHSVRLSLLI